MTLVAALNDTVKAELAAVERLFADELRSELPCVNALVKHVGRFQGKMLRPMLVLLSGKACGELCEAHTVLAAVTEMVHMATLVHDDVLDEAELRRKGATINHLRGNEAAVMLGDFLISHSYHLCSSLDSQFASRLIARTTNEVCEGELLQIHNRNNLDLDEETYLHIVSAKTASLCAACCTLGARFAGAAETQARQLEAFGRFLGIAFQIQDDILDIAGDAAAVGKTLGLDIEKEKMTLPMIRFMATAPPQHAELLRSLMSGQEDGKVERVRQLILGSGAIDYARERAQAYAHRAKRSLAALPDTEARRLLEGMAEFAVERGR